MMKKIIAIIIAISSFNTYSQCVIKGIVDVETPLCGECITLTAIGNTGTNVFNDNFNSGVASGWAYTSPANFFNNCSANGIDGTTHMWMGSNSGTQRRAETFPYDFTVGGTICFDMLYGVQGANSPCEGPDMTNEGVYLQYSTDGGGSWFTIAYHDPLGGYNENLTEWNKYCYEIPAGAQTTGVKIRWYQDSISGTSHDHWGIDNVEIHTNDPLLNISWQHDGYSYGLGNTGGEHPVSQCLKNDSSFIVKATNGIVTCYDTVDVKIRMPLINNFSLPFRDTLICGNQCIPISLGTYILTDSAKQKEYISIQQDSIDESGGIGNIASSVSYDINIQGINKLSIDSNTIKKVCINGLSIYKSSMFSTLDINDVKIELISPDSNSVILVNDNTTVGGGGLGYHNGYLNTCFTSGAPNITTATYPYTGNWSPTESYDSLIGTSINGTWRLKISENNSILNLKGSIDAFSITFNDDSLYYPAVANWSHTTWLSDSNLNPLVCPQSDTSYILTVSDSNNCVSLTDTVSFFVSPYTNAGKDSSFVSCDTNQVNLSDYLEDSTQTGGYWLDPSNNTVTMPVYPTSSLNGNYIYVTSNTSGCYDSAIIEYNSSLFSAIPYYYKYQDISTNDIYVVDSSYGDTNNVFYYWEFGDGNTSYLRYPSHTYSTHGIYNLCLTISDSSGCFAEYCDTLEVDSLGNLSRSNFTINIVPHYTNTVNVEEHKKKKNILYPNPSSGLFILKNTTLNKINSYKIFNVFGQKVYSGYFESDKHIDVSHLENGIYHFVYLEDNTKRTSIKFIICK